MNSDIRGKSQLCPPLPRAMLLLHRVVSSFLTMAQSLCQYRIAWLLLPLTRGRDRRAFAEGQLPSFSAWSIPGWVMTGLLGFTSKFLVGPLCILIRTMNVVGGWIMLTDASWPHVGIRLLKNIMNAAPCRSFLRLRTCLTLTTTPAMNSSSGLLLVFERFSLAVLSRIRNAPLNSTYQQRATHYCSCIYGLINEVVIKRIWAEPECPHNMAWWLGLSKGFGR